MNEILGRETILQHQINFNLPNVGYRVKFLLLNLVELGRRPTRCLPCRLDKPDPVTLASLTANAGLWKTMSKTLWQTRSNGSDLLVSFALALKARGVDLEAKHDRNNVTNIGSAGKGRATVQQPV